ncbi:MAG: Ig-like domain-containing protein [Cyanobacteria bacterium J06597_1]
MNDSARLYFVSPDLLAIQIDAGSVQLGLGVEPDTFTGEQFEPGVLLNAANYAISSSTDPLFATEIGLEGAQLYLKTETTDVAFLDRNDRFNPSQLEWAQQYTVYVQLPDGTSLTRGDTYTIDFTGELESGIRDIQGFEYNPEQFVSEAIHVAQIGYDPDDPKIAFLSEWLGQTASRESSPSPDYFQEGLRFWIVDAATGQRVEDDSVVRETTLSLEAGTDEDVRSGFQNYSRTNVFSLEFSDFQQEGRYYIEVDGVGRSFEFEIAENTWERAFQISMQGLYNQRSGTAIGGPYSETEYLRSFHPDDGVLIFPTDSLTTTVDGQPVSVEEVQLIDTREGFDFRRERFRDAFDRYSEAFDLNGNGRIANDELSQFIQPLDDAWGGYKDAGDWDRRIQHLFGTRQHLGLLAQFPDYFESIDLNIPDTLDSFPTLDSLETAVPSNGIPDILDESLWGLDFFRRLQTSDGGIRGGIESARAPIAGETSWEESQTVFAYAPDPWSSYIYAGVAARAARLLGQYDAALATQYRDSALRAMNWAEAELPTDDSYDVRQIDDERNLAALELYLLTEDPVWHQLFLETTVFAGGQCGLGQPCNDTFKNGSHDQREAAQLYARAPQDLTDATTQSNTIAALLRAADNSLAVQNGGLVTLEGRPLTGTQAGTAFNQTRVNTPFMPLSPGQLGTPQMDDLLAAYGITGDRQYLDGAVKGSHFSAGANPSNTVFTSGLVDAGLAQREPVNTFVIDARSTGQSTPAGITAYGPIDSQFGFNQAQRDLYGQRSFPFPTAWPVYENYFDNYWNFEQAEFTIHQSISPTAFTWGYLAASDSIAPPIVTTPIPNQVLEDGSSVNLDISGNFSDRDGSIVSYFALGLPSGLSIDRSSGGISGTLAADASLEPGVVNPANQGSRDYSIRVIATDDDGANISQVFTLSAVNVDPVANDDRFSTDEETPVNGNVLEGLGADLDGSPDGDVLSVINQTNPSNGSVTLDANGDFTYTPDAGFVGTDSFRYTVSDGNGGSDTAVVTIVVSPPNTLPDAVDDAASTDEDAAVSGNVLDGSNGGLDTDLDGDTLAVIENTDPANGSVTLGSEGSFTYTPNPDFNGTDSFTYTVSDGNGGTDSATVTITVGATNDNPDAVDDVTSTDEDTAVTGNVLDGTNGGLDTDLDGDTLTVVSNTNPTNGTVTINATGEFTYTPNADFNGTDSFTYTISDGNGTDTATVSITVGATNDLPVAADDTTTTDEDVAVTGNVLDGSNGGRDTDRDGDTLTVIANTVPSNGMVTVEANGEFTYTPDANFNGSDSFTYTVSDGNGGTDTATVSVTVNPTSNSAIYLSFAQDGSIGDLSFNDEDILLYDPSSGEYELYADLSDVGGTGDIDAVHVADDGSVLLSFESPISLSGLGTVDDSDIVRFAPTSTGADTAGTLELVFDGSDVGLTTSSEDIDSVALTPDGDLIISVKGFFDAGGVSGRDEDLLRFEASSLGGNTSGNLSLYFDGSDVGLSDGNSEDVEGVSVDPNGALFLNTLGNVSVPGLSGDATDISIFDSSSLGNGTSGTFSQFFDGSANGLAGLRLDGISVSNGNSPTGDTTPPTISSITPADDSTNVAVDSNLQIQFSEVVQAGTGEITLRRLSDNSKIETIGVNSTQVTISGSTVTIDPSDDLDVGTGVYVEIDAGVFEDGAGNGFAGISDNSSWNFTTAAPPTGLDNLVFVSSSLDGTVDGVSYSNEDVLAYNPVTGEWQQYFDGSDVGLTGEVDAVHVADDGSLLLSLGSPATVSGLGTVDDSDIIRFIPTSTGDNTAGTFERVFDGSDVGLTTNNEDIDGIALTPDGDLIISVKGFFKAGGVSGRDEDLLRFEANSLGGNTSGNLSLYFDGSDVGLSGGNSEDVDGIWIAPDRNEIVLSTNGSYTVPGQTGDGDDLLQFVPISLGNKTSGTFEGTIFNGTEFGISDIDAFSLTTVGQ